MLWTISSTIAIMSHLSTINRDVSYMLAAPLIAAIRIFYSSSVAWMILASAMGHGGIFAKVFNCSIFVHLNKLSYGIYLLNPLIITVIYGLKDHSTHLDPISAVRVLLLILFWWRRATNDSTFSAGCDVNWCDGHCLCIFNCILTSIRSSIHEALKPYPKFQKDKNSVNSIGIK